MENEITFFWYRRQEKTVMKLVVDAETDKVLGASMCGPDAPEIMQVLYSVFLSFVCICNQKGQCTPFC